MLYHKKKIFSLRHLCLFATAIFLSFSSIAQCVITWDQVNNAKNNIKATPTEILGDLYLLKKKAEQCNVTTDSVYARLLDFIAAYEYKENRNYRKSLAFALQSLQINKTGSKGSSAFYAMQGYYNVGYYYYAGLNMYDKALLYLDSANDLTRRFNYAHDVILDSKLIKAFILQRKGDYQKSIEESKTGEQYSLQIKDSIRYAQFLILQGQSHFNQGLFEQSLAELQTALPILTRINEQYSRANALKMMALIYAKTNSLTAAESCFKQCIQARISTGNVQQVAADYKDFGTLYWSLDQYNEAKPRYLKAIEYARQIEDSVILANIYITLAINSLSQGNNKNAEAYCKEAIKYLKLGNGITILETIRSDALRLLGDKEIAYSIMTCKTELLLNLFKSTHDKRYLNACLQTALVTDSVITDMRHGQFTERSKLYWRNFTRLFFIDAMEACFLANDANLAFFFMEKSSAVLLNDKLKELGAAAWLPPAEATREENLRANIIELQQKLLYLEQNPAAYQSQQAHLLQAKEDLEHFIKSLEQKYPRYYQYKYADDVPSLEILQQYLSKSDQSFIHYFISDTVTYALSITHAGTKLIKLPASQFRSDQLAAFLQFCSNKNALNNHYNSYLSNAHAIYKALFQPLNIPKGRVIICTDNFLVPFEALPADPAGNHLLIHDYAFSYVYSARYMLNKPNGQVAKGDFLGVAPVSFASYMQVPGLFSSEKAIKNAAGFYSSTMLLSNAAASSKNFLQQLPDYTIVNIFSHASADSTQSEPYLCMTDSLIYLSRLQVINNPATRLVILSACETNAGKHATGEGIFSLARGFALAGIPSVSATLWKADENTIYAITELFNKNIAAGMSKDEALQQAKLSFLKNNSGEKLLPYYWSNIVMVGNTDPLRLTAKNNSKWWYLAGMAILVAVAFVVLKKRQHNPTNPGT